MTNFIRYAHFWIVYVPIKLIINNTISLLFYYKVSIITNNHSSALSDDQILAG